MEQYSPGSKCKLCLINYRRIYLKMLFANCWRQCIKMIRLGHINVSVCYVILNRSPLPSIMKTEAFSKGLALELKCCDIYWQCARRTRTAIWRTETSAAGTQIHTFSLILSLGYTIRIKGGADGHSSNCPSH